MGHQHPVISVNQNLSPLVYADVDSPLGQQVVCMHVFLLSISPRSSDCLAYRGLIVVLSFAEHRREENDMVRMLEIPNLSAGPNKETGHLQSGCCFSSQIQNQNFVLIELGQELCVLLEQRVFGPGDLLVRDSGEFECFACQLDDIRELDE